jgi:hypothetical protein
VEHWLRAHSLSHRPGGRQFCAFTRSPGEWQCAAGPRLQRRFVLTLTRSLGRCDWTQSPVRFSARRCCGQSTCLGEPAVVVYVFVHTHARLRAQTHTNTHTHTRARAQSHTHTHAHTHTHTHGASWAGGLSGRDGLGTGHGTGWPVPSLRMTQRGGTRREPTRPALENNWPFVLLKP